MLKKNFSRQNDFDVNNHTRSVGLFRINLYPISSYHYVPASCHFVSFFRLRIGNASPKNCNESTVWVECVWYSRTGFKNAAKTVNKLFSARNWVLISFVEPSEMGELQFVSSLPEIGTFQPPFDKLISFTILSVTSRRYAKIN